MNARLHWTLFFFLLLFAPIARGGDGVLEINQTCAVAGCFAGDTAGFPVLITTAGSYRLTSNLDVSGAPVPADATAVDIRANGVSLDLAGFTISGSNVCTLGVCTQTGTGRGVQGNGDGNHQETAVRNGVIRGMGGPGISCDRGCTVEGVRLESNGGDGIVLFNGPSMIRGNVVRNNGGYGIWAGGVITENVVERNGAMGIFGQNSGVISANSVRDNRGTGVRCTNSTVIDNTIHSNGDGATGGYGVLIGGRCGLARNSIVENVTGTFDPAGGALVEIGPNLCDTDLVCP